MKILTLPFFVLISSLSVAQTTTIKLADLERILSDTTDQRIHVINFWATWCAPCVKELPLFEDFQSNHAGKAKVTLISVDYSDKIEKVNSFISRKKIKSEVLLLDEVDGNRWIDKVEPAWGGAIPATLILDPITGHRKFIDKELKEGDLDKILTEFETKRSHTK